ncbi:Hypothetical protein CINCED_3A023319 [Cinara cedri]|uniref:Uncharacterized protein n=1 Tax=Cinara cedri TaxID=506608 RepID=A0A5E4LZM2_9HEMI|nr:Hypothetical protein CINCED_3A023319 [Cinara cedri]
MSMYLFNSETLFLTSFTRRGSWIFNTLPECCGIVDETIMENRKVGEILDLKEQHIFVWAVFGGAEKSLQKSLRRKERALNDVEDFYCNINKKNNNRIEKNYEEVWDSPYRGLKPEEQ